MSDPFSLERFEFLCYTRSHELATREFLKLMALLNTQSGSLSGIEATFPATGPGDRDAVLLTRIASGLSCLFSDPAFVLSAEGFERLIASHRWIAALFAASPFINADHILRALSANGLDAPIAFDHQSFLKFCLLYTPDAELPVEVDLLWAHDKLAAAALFLALLSPRFLGTEAAHAKREALLGWLPERLSEIEDFGRLPLAILHDVYLNCSYAELRSKHEIKRAINEGVRRQLPRIGASDLDLSGPRGEIDGKPVLLVALEWFSGDHSVFRSHSASLRGLRARFHVVGLGAPGAVDAPGRAVFDAFHLLPEELGAQVRAVRDHAARLRPAVFYLPAVGMFLYSIYVSNLRLAPVQVAALGHGASTQSPFIDYFALEEDLIGDPATFSETLIRLPQDAMPCGRSSAAPLVAPLLRPRPDVVRIAVAATTMKLNPRMMRALRRIADESQVEVRFEFFVGFARGLLRIQVERFVAGFLPGAVVHEHQPYAPYLNAIAACDLVLNPFPYGNYNGVADMALAGLVGVCRTGPHVHEHIDGGLFRRLGLPDWLIADSDDAYVAAALRLIERHEERLALRRDLIARGGDKPLCEGRPEILGERLLALARRAGVAP